MANVIDAFVQNHALSQRILDKIVNELYNAGLNAYQIANVLKTKTADVIAMLKGKSPYPSSTPNVTLINEILSAEGINITLDAIVETEKERYSKYAMIESACLDTMLTLLTYYKSLPVGEDLKQDRFVASLANDFIKATQTARQELLRRYEIEHGVTIDDKMLKVELDFV